jgi:hypothetical protein
LAFCGASTGATNAVVCLCLLPPTVLIGRHWCSSAGEGSGAAGADAAAMAIASATI